MSAAILRRPLPLFGVVLVWDGSYITAYQMTGKRGRPRILERHKVWGLITATKKMKEIEEQYHQVCSAMV